MKARITLDIPKQDTRRVREIAEKWGCTFAQVIERMLQAYCDEDGVLGTSHRSNEE
jgi:hypothetical protein